MNVSFTRFYPPWRVLLSSKRLRVISTIISVSNKIMKGCKYSRQRYNKPDRRKRNRFAFSTSILFFRSFHSYFQIGSGRLISDDNHRNISRNGQDTPWMKVNFTRSMPLTVRFYDPLFFLRNSCSSRGNCIRNGSYFSGSMLPTRNDVRRNAAGRNLLIETSLYADSLFCSNYCHETRSKWNIYQAISL